MFDAPAMLVLPLAAELVVIGTIEYWHLLLLLWRAIRLLFAIVGPFLLPLGWWWASSVHGVDVVLLAVYRRQTVVLKAVRILAMGSW